MYVICTVYVLALVINKIDRCKEVCRIFILYIFVFECVASELTNLAELINLFDV